MNIELAKTLLESAKTKMYLFGAMSGGSFAYLVKQNTPLLITFAVSIAFIVGIYGVIVNLKKISIIEKRLQELQND